MLKKVTALNNLKARVAEQFRTLRTNIQFSSLGNEVKTIVITSSLPSEGKSTVVSNLAITMARSDKRVVIVDCDLRKPSIHKKFSLPNSRGVTNILAQRKTIKEVIIRTNVPNLYVISSGPIPPNPSELLSTQKMKDILEELESNFDMVLLDTPPILSVTDAQILSTLAQGTILVTSYGKVEKKLLLNAKESIEKVGGKILGVVINKIPEKAKDQYNNYYE
jgi:capsular exopolysaccharide synthesis family protein